MLVAVSGMSLQINMRKNIKHMQNAGADTVITSCPACDMMWRQTTRAGPKKLGIEYNIKTSTTVKSWRKK